MRHVRVPDPGPGQVLVWRRAPRRDLRHRRRAVRAGARLLRPGQVVVSRCARATSGAARCPRPARAWTSAGGRAGHRGHHARLRPVPPVRGPGRHRVCADRSEIGITGWPGALAEKLVVSRPAACSSANVVKRPGRRAGGSRAGTRGARWRPRTPGQDEAADLGAGQHRAARDGLRARGGRGGGRGRPRFSPRRSWPGGLRRGALLHHRGARPRAVPTRSWSCTARTESALALRCTEPGGRIVYIGLSRRPAGEQPGDRAERRHGGGHPRRVGGPGARHRALRGRTGETRGARPGLVGLDRAARRSPGSSTPAREPRSTSTRGCSARDRAGRPP